MSKEPKEKSRVAHFFISNDMYETVRRDAFERRINMSDIYREAVKMYYEQKNKK